MTKIALYPGSFDPITFGHLDLVKRALKIFDKLVIGIAANLAKEPFFTLEEREAMVREATAQYPNVEVESFSELLVEYMTRKGISILIRGLRVVSDFEYEFQMALMNRELSPQIEPLFLIPNKEYTFLSSSLVKEIARLGGDIRKLAPECVVKKLKEKFRGG
jgi:pantetheine-phosphate adenylyltransferase